MDRTFKGSANGLIGVDEARGIVADQFRPERYRRVPLADATGLVLAEDVWSPGDFPPFSQSNVDGYAFAYGDLQTSAMLRVQHEVAEAGNDRRLVLDNRSAVRIFTGAPVPDLADSVVMQEEVMIKEGYLHLDRLKIGRGANIRTVGSDIPKGEKALLKGTILSGPAIGLLASLGLSDVPVIARPNVSIIITGSELVAPGQPLRYGHVYEANGAMLRALLSGLPAVLLDVVYVKDDEKWINDALERALELADVVLLTGGASVGDYDFVARAASSCGVRQLFHKVRQKPGKPLYFGRKDEIDIFGLPGNPSSVLVCFYLYVLPVLFAWAGYIDSPTMERCRLADAYRKPAEFTAVLKAYVKGNDVVLLDKQASYQLSAFGLANGLVVLPEGVSEVKAGDRVDVIRISGRIS